MFRSKIWGVVFAAVGTGAIGPIGCGNAESSSTEETSSSYEPLIQVPANGGVITLAGNGQRGALDNAVATNATFNDPAGVAAATDGTIYIADWGNNSVRRVKPNGTVDTFVQGNPNLVFNGRAEETPSGSPGIPQWSGSWIPATRSDCPACGSPFDGSRVFWGNGVARTSQQRGAVDLLPYRNNIDAGLQNVRLSFVYKSPAATGGQVSLQFLSSTGANLGGRTKALVAPSVWTQGADDENILVPPQTTDVKIQLSAGGPNSVFDAIQIRPLPLVSVSPVVDPGLIGPTAVAVAPNGDVYVGGNGVTIVNSAGTTFTRVVASGSYQPPRLVSSISILPDGTAYFVDPTNVKLHVRSPSGVGYYADLQAVPNGEALAVAVAPQGANHRVWGVFRGYLQVYGEDCPVPASPVAGSTVTCNQASVTSFGINQVGFTEDLDGTAGGERFGYMGAIALGRFGDLIIGEESNNAVDRLFAPFTQHAAGTGVLGFADGASNQAKFFSPSGVAVAPDGGIIVADRMNNRIRKILCGGTNMCAASGNACPVTATDDQNSCTTDSCMVLAIKHDALANGVACTDGNACTVADTCSAAVCQSGTPVATNDNNACTTDACNSSTGVVSHTPVPTNDNDNCTIDACDTAIGTVTHTPKTFADSNTTDCLVPVCNPANGAAMNVDAAEGTPCGAANSGQRCALNHVCEVAAPTFTPPALDSSTGTDFGKLTDDIWKGAGAVQKLPNQTNISATKIDPGHAGWLIGQVKTAGGLPMPNVVVSTQRRRVR